MSYFGGADDRAPLRPLWHQVVATARDRRWYAAQGDSKGLIADSIAGRFDAITLVLSAVLLRMEGEPALVTPSVRLTELFVEDMDGQLRESGVGDLVVGKHIGKLVSVLGGRIGGLREALGQPGDAALTDMLGRNLTLAPGADPALAVPLLRQLVTRLAETETTTLLKGEIGL